jgi:hypothetical protein
VRRVLAVAILTSALLALLGVGSASAREFGTLYNDGQIYRTFGVPASLPHGGTDPIYSFTNGVEGQLSVSGVAPGDKGYHGGRWAVYVATFADGVDPYLLTSDEAVLAAAANGDLIVTRTPQADFRCPVLPGSS